MIKSSTLVVFCVIMFTILFGFTPRSNSIADIVQQFDRKNSVPISDVITQSDVELDKGRFNRSFDLLREVLPKALQHSDTNALITLYRRLGVLYGKFGQDSLSVAHMKKAVNMARVCFRNGTHKKGHLVSAYHGVASQYAAMKEYDLALKYMDSCYLMSKKKKRLYFVDGLYGKVYTEIGDYNKARAYLNGIIHYFEKSGNPYLVTAYFNSAELNAALGERDSAEYYLNRSLHIVDSLLVHPMLKPTLLEKLAVLAYQSNRKEMAFEYMQKAKVISDSMFHFHSKNNKELFELKSKYSADITRKDEKILEQERLLDLKDKASLRLKLLIGILILLAGIAIVTIRQRFRLKQVLYEQVLKNEKNSDILEIKNKELAVNALQLIEKEHMIKELLGAVELSEPEKYRSLNHKYKQNSKKLWADFHVRFTQINDKFYTNLIEIEPSFTPTELKHCALIKLNFDSKEMAQILGVSQNTVHMSRSRIRKKLNLAREDSLSNYITGV